MASRAHHFKFREGKKGLVTHPPARTHALTPLLRFIIFFEGGGWCYNEKDCANRSNGDLGSSKDYVPDMARGDWSNGVTSDDCDLNPAFCDHTLVYIKYCDGDSFSGAREGVVTVGDKDLHFKGHYILEAVMLDLLQNYGLGDATDVVLTGCSAGGLSTFLHSDYVGSWFDETVKYGVVPVSGMFQMQANNVHDEPVMPEQMQSIFELANATAGVHQGCVAANTDPDELWKCNIAPTVYEHIESPIFILDSSIDSWQNGCIRTATRVDQSVPQDQVPNGNCGTAAGYEDCGGNPAACSPEQIYSVIEYQSAFVRTMTNADTFWKETNGAFIYECSTHCSGSNTNYCKFVYPEPRQRLARTLSFRLAHSLLCARFARAQSSSPSRTPS
jgi:hypothetical protein